MNEEILHFGADHELVGILTHSASGAPDIACLLPNIGLAHRVGPHRLMVKLARHLAQCGIPALRFDLSGIGDSPAARTPADVVVQAVLDMRAALDALAIRHGIRRFIVFGICSGAYNAYFLTVADERVVGVMMYDGFAFPSRMSRLLHHACELIFAPAGQLLVRLARRARQRSPASPDVDMFTAGLNAKRPSPAQFRQELARLVSRGVAVFALFSGGVQRIDFGRGQWDGLGDARLLDRVVYRFEPDLDHTASTIEGQQKLFRLVCEWGCQIRDRDGHATAEAALGAPGAPGAPGNDVLPVVETG